MGGALSRVLNEGECIVGGSGGILPQEDFQIWRLLNAIFSTCHEICLRKIDLQYENGKQLQVTIIKITESKENKSIYRLDLSGSIGPGRAAALLPPNTPTLALALIIA